MLAVRMIKIVAAVILIVVVFMSGHHWRKLPMTSGLTTVNQPTFTNGVEVAWARMGH